MELLAETRIGPYTVTAPIGSGGMGEVYRAHDPRLERDVALKILSPAYAQNNSVITRFQNEAKAIAALSHPNILAVYDCGFDEGLFYIATELLEGETLRDHLGGRPLPWKRAMKIAQSVADALRAAHARGIVHRDLKPENIYITRDGMVKILDFGLAQVSTEADAGSAVRTLTTPGSILGTIGYMSPEQVEGVPVDARSDIFSFGCVLYEMLAGRKAFPGTSAAQILSAILRDEPEDLRAICADVPEEVVRVVEHCLEKHKGQRFQDCADLMFALRAAAEAPSRNSGSSTPARPFRRASTLSLAALLVIIGATIFVGRRANSPAAPPIRPIASLAVMPFANTTGNTDVDVVAEGLTQGIINNLSPVKGFVITPWNSVSFYRDRRIDAREIRSDLGVDALAVGRVSRRADSYVVAVELIDARDNHLIWGERYDRPLPNLEAELSGHIAEKLQMRLSGSDERRISRRAAAKPEAYTQYQLGLYEMDKRTPAGLEKGIACFRRALEIDPTYAEAWVGIADSYMLLGGLYEIMPPREAMPKAAEAARAALALDSSLADAHASLGNIRHEYDWDWPAAEEEFKRAIELNPNCVAAHHWYGQALVYRGRLDEGMRELRRAEEIDPRSLVSRTDIAQAYWIARDYDRAIAKAQAIMDIEPQFWLAHWILGLSYAGKKDFTRAASALERAVELGGTPAARGSLGYVYARAGRRADALQVIDGLRRMEQGGRYVSPAAYAMIYEGLGDYDRAWQEVERAAVERASLVTAIQKAPITDDLRNDGRYASFARRVGLPPLP